MAKLSDAQINAITFYATGEGDQPRANTRTALIKNGLLNENNTVTTDGYAAAGIEVPTTTVDEIEELLNAPIGSLESDVTPDDERRQRVDNLVNRSEMFRKGWRNTSVWHGLSQAEIQKDIKTAVPVGRAARRYAAKHANHNH